MTLGVSEEYRDSPEEFEGGRTEPLSKGGGRLGGFEKRGREGVSRRSKEDIGNRPGLEVRCGVKLEFVFVL